MSVIANSPAGARTVVLASPRSFCAGVERAIAVVEQSLDQRGGPIYVRKQIVHNTHVVADPQGRGAVFVDELETVPDGAMVVFSAHGPGWSRPFSPPWPSSGSSPWSNARPLVRPSASACPPQCAPHLPCSAPHTSLEEAQQRDWSHPPVLGGSLP
jgi:LytB protein